MRKSAKCITTLLAVAVMVVGTTISASATAPNVVSWKVSAPEGNSDSGSVRVISPGTGIPGEITCTIYNNFTGATSGVGVIFTGENLKYDITVSAIGWHRMDKNISTTGYEYTVRYETFGNRRLEASGKIKG